MTRYDVQKYCIQCQIWFENGCATLIGDFAQRLKKVNKINDLTIVQLCKCTCLHMRTAYAETLMFIGLCSCAVVHFYKKGKSGDKSHIPTPFFFLNIINKTVR